MGAYVPYDPETEVFLNNFFTRFPLNDGSDFSNGIYRTCLADCWDVPIRTKLRSVYLEVKFSGSLEDYCAKHSDKYLAQTPREFFAELDSTVVEVGLSLEAIAAKIHSYQAASKHLFESPEARRLVEQASEELNSYLTPVYVALREKGYNRKELRG